MGTYKVGDTNPYIKNIQRALNEKLGPNSGTTLPGKAYLKPDGGFGPKTRDALVAYQLSIGLPGSGIYDLTTSNVLDPFIQKRYLNEQDYINAANALGCEVAMVKAVTEVESGDAGFFDGGKTKILFERHVFRQQLLKLMKASTITAVDIAKKIGVAATGPTGIQIDVIDKALQTKYPDLYNTSTGGYIGGVAEYDRLGRAKSLNDSCATQACSWGMFQIMGYHFALLKFANVNDMVHAFDVSEGAQLQGFVNFILADQRLLKAIRARDYLAFALAYNGPAQQGYDVRIKDAYAKWSMRSIMINPTMRN